MYNIKQILKKGRSQIVDLCFHIKKSEKEDKQRNQEKDLIKIKMETSVCGGNLEKIIKTKSLKINKIEKFLRWLSGKEPE